MKMIVSYNTVFIVVLIGSSQGKQFTLPDTLLEYCPYTSFCENSASQVFPKTYSQKFTPCCQPCSCSETCGFYKNCCHRDFDNVTKQENKQPVCRRTSTRDLFLTSYYEMIDECYGKIKVYDNVNKNEGSIFDSNFQPVYSPSKKLTYINEKYAHCNNVTDGINWQQTVSCASESTFSDLVGKIIEGNDFEVSKDCILKYLPPKGFDLTPSRCEPDVIRTCNVSGLVYERDISWDLCTEFNATFINIFKNKLHRYGNIFCWLCNKIQAENKTMIIPSKCPASVVVEGDESKQLTSLPLTVVMDTIDEVTIDLPQTIVGQCLPNEVFLNSFQHSCRPRQCPFGQIMLNNKCHFYSSQWYGGPFSFLLKLTPLNNETIPMVFFINMSAGYRSDSLADWLQRGSLKDWHVVPLFRTTADQTAVRYLITKVTYPQSSSSVDPSYLHDVIKQAQKKKWMLKNGVERYRLQVSLNEVLNYNPVERDNLLRIGMYTSTHTTYVFIPDYLLYKSINMTVYDEYLIFFDNVPKEIFETGIFLSQLFFCDQIDLLPEEYKYLYATILFKVTNKTIYGASFRNVMMEMNQGSSSKNATGVNSKQISTVRICLEEFLDHQSRRDSSCRIFWSCILIVCVSLAILFDLKFKFI